MYQERSELIQEYDGDGKWELTINPFHRENVSFLNRFIVLTGTQT